MFLTLTAQNLQLYSWCRTGNILWEDNIDEVRDPASMSKMFTLYLLFEEMAKGKITLDTTITATETDQAISRIYEISNNNIVAGVAYPIRDLITMTIVPSSNATTMWLRTTFLIIMRQILLILSTKPLNHLVWLTPISAMPAELLPKLFRVTITLNAMI